MTGRPSLREALADAVVVLDGGLATELERRGHDLSDALWSARLLRDDPAEVLSTHAAHLAAGARVATTASYQASFEGFAAAGVGRDEAARLLRRSVRLAGEARDAAEADGLPRWVAASVGPYGAVLADGSEYRGTYGLSVQALREFHRPRLEVLADAGPDVLACETVPCLAEVEALVAEVDRLGVPAWLSLTCAGPRTRAGEPVDEAFAVAASSPHVVAVGVNCTAPDDVAALVGAAARTGLPAVAYPNSGETWDAAARAWTGDPRLRPGQVRAWVDAGARLVGGCCRVGPAEIRAISDALSET